MASRRAAKSKISPVVKWINCVESPPPGRRQKVFAPGFEVRAGEAARHFERAVFGVLNVILAEALAVADRDKLGVGAVHDFHGDGLAMASGTDGWRW